MLWNWGCWIFFTAVGLSLVFYGSCGDNSPGALLMLEFSFPNAIPGVCAGFEAARPSWHHGVQKLPDIMDLRQTCQALWDSEVLWGCQHMGGWNVWISFSITWTDQFLTGKRRSRRLRVKRCIQVCHNKLQKSIQIVTSDPKSHPFIIGERGLNGASQGWWWWWWW